jgi:hypothetical protein
MRGSVLTYQESFVFWLELSKCAAVHDHLYTNDNIQDNEYEAVFDIQTQNKSHDLYVRNVGGQMYVRKVTGIHGYRASCSVRDYDSFTTDESLDVETDVRSRLTCVWESHVQHFDIFHRTFGTMFGAGAIRDSLCTGTWGGV